MKTGVIAVIVLVAVLVIAGGIFLFSNTYQAPENNEENLGDTAGTGTPETPSGTIDNTTNIETPSGVSAQTYNIEISSSAFNPSSLTINAGDTVIWTNQDSFSHTVTSDSGSELKSSSFSSGGTYNHIFTTAGTYDYHCAIHTMMKGTIIVQ
jgi:plastocyanin